MFELIQKLSITKGLNLIFIVFGCLIAPYWFLYQFGENIYNEIGLSKFILLSLSIGVPACLGFTIFNSFFFKAPKEISDIEKIEYRFLLMGVSSAFCGFTFYLPCIAKYILPDISQKEAIRLILYAYIGSFSFWLLHTLKKYYKRRKDKKVNK